MNSRDAGRGTQDDTLLNYFDHLLTDDASGDDNPTEPAELVEGVSNDDLEKPNAVPEGSEPTKSEPLQVEEPQPAVEPEPPKQYKPVVESQSLVESQSFKEPQPRTEPQSPAKKSLQAPDTQPIDTPVFKEATDPAEDESAVLAAERQEKLKSLLERATLASLTASKEISAPPVVVTGEAQAPSAGSLKQVNSLEQVNLHEKNDSLEQKAEAAEVRQAAPLDCPITSEEEHPVVSNTDSVTRANAPDSATSTGASIDTPQEIESPNSQWHENGRPVWAQQQFDVLTFSVQGLRLAVPLVALGKIQPLEDKLSAIAGQSDWVMGLYLNRGESIKTVNTALFVMPERYDPKFVERAEYVITINGISWGLAIDSVEQIVSLGPEEVNWRGARTKRPWLAGTVKEHMCALLDIYLLGDILDRSNKPAP